MDKLQTAPLLQLRDSIGIAPISLLSVLAPKIKRLLNFEFYCFQTGNCPINENVFAGDVISFIDGNKI